MPLTKFANISDAVAFLDAKYGAVLSNSNSNIIKGKTGGPAFIKSRTAFGFTLFGKGKFEGMPLLSFAELSIWRTG